MSWANEKQLDNDSEGISYEKDDIHIHCVADLHSLSDKLQTKE